MLLLLIASVIWAFSFGLIDSSGIPGKFLACARLALATCVFLPFLRRVPLRQMAVLLLIGAVQFGLMYVCYNESFVYLQSHEVALFTVFTPFYVALLFGARNRRLSWSALLAAFLATVGAGVVLWRKDGFPSVTWHGFLLVQGSNLCFAVGQLVYREWSCGKDRPADVAVMGWLYLGGVLATLPWVATAVWHDAMMLTAKQILVVVYLGVIASGLGFFLWNAGVRRTAAGVLAVFNNLKIPLAAVVSFVVFKEAGNPVQLLVGGVFFVAATWFSQRSE